MKVKCWLILLCMGMLSLSQPVRSQSGGDPLPRRGYFGVGLEKAENGARVFSVAADSTAEAFKIAIGDVIEAVDGRPATSPDVVVPLMDATKPSRQNRFAETAPPHR
jgi:S1-C subfamily serine protease